MPKDGPSAGITLTTAITSLLTGIPVRDDLAMTGEITLRGQVLPIGGVKDKVLAARRAGLTTVILPKRNEGDLDDLPKDARKAMHFVLADNIDDVLRTALERPLPVISVPVEPAAAIEPKSPIRQQEIAVVA